MFWANAVIRVVSFLVLASCGLYCQRFPFTDWAQGFRAGGASALATEHRKTLAWESLPNAPCGRLPSQAGRSRVLADEAVSSLAPGGSEMRGILPQNVTLTTKFSERSNGTFLGRYLFTPLPIRPNALGGNSFMGRALNAASRVLVTNDGRLNAAYFLGVLSSAAVHSSSRAYGPRSPSAAFSDFGSTIGGDAGLNVFHAFEPDIRHIMKSISPKFLSKIEERIARSASQRNLSSIPER